MLETNIESQLKSIFNSLGFTTRSIHGKTSDDNGVPDVVVIRGDITFLFEVKRDDNDLSIFQMLFLRKCDIAYKVELINNEFIFTHYYIKIQKYNLIEFKKLHNIL